MVTRVRVLFAVICLLVPSMASAADYVTYVIKRGENVSKIVLKLTGSSNYRKDGIVVAIMVNGTDTGRFVPKDKLGYVLPGWEVRIKQDLAKTELVKGSAGKTLAQVCVGSADPRCAPRLARLNGITTSRTPRSVIRSRMSRILADDVYALPGFLAPVVAKAKVVVDACLNIDGVQESIPPGWVADSKGNCGFPPPLPLPSSSASSFSFPPSYLLWLIPPLLIGIILFFRYRNRQSSARNSAIKSRLEDIASKFEAAFKKRLPPKHDVKVDRELDVTHSKCSVYISPVNGSYPNLTDHAENLLDDVQEIRKELRSEPFTIQEPFAVPSGVCVELVYVVGGGL